MRLAPLGHAVAFLDRGGIFAVDEVAMIHVLNLAVRPAGLLLEKGCFQIRSVCQSSR
jgi:hypothetical protein